MRVGEWGVLICAWVTVDIADSGSGSLSLSLAAHTRDQYEHGRAYVRSSMYSVADRGVDVLVTGIVECAGGHDRGCVL